MINIEQHPCFNDKARHTFSRVHLPVAPKCNIQCKFCDRSYDCMNESRPGVTSAVLSPKQAMHYLEKINGKVPNLSVVGIAGPGDPFANADETMETLRLVRAKYPDVLLCVASNGLNAAPYAKELAYLELSHLTITVNAIEPAVGANVYSWVRDKKRIYRGEEGARILWERQQEAIHSFKEAGVVLKVNTILIPGVNDHHISDIASKMKEMGVDIINPLPFYPVAGAEFADLPEPSKEMVSLARKQVEEHVPVMTHCMRCRADAAGILGKDLEEGKDLLKKCAELPLDPGQERPFIAAASREGLLVNMHLGEAEEFYVFQQKDGGYFPYSVRKAPPKGGGDARWQAVAEVLKDCQAILVSKVGAGPKDYLTKSGIKVFEMSGMISQGLSAVFHGREIPSELQVDMAPCPKASSGEGGACACPGQGMGCM